MAHQDGGSPVAAGARLPPGADGAGPPRDSRVVQLETENRVLARIATGAPLGEILHDLIAVLEAQSDREMLASVLLLDGTGRHLVTGAAPRLPPDYNAAVNGIAIGPCAGSCGTAAFRGEPVVVEDIAADPLWCDARDLALSHGLRACWSVPIQAADGRVLGTFAIYYREPRRPAPQDLRALTVMAQTAALAIERHLFEQERQEHFRRVETLNETLTREIEHRTRERDRIWDHSRDLLLVAERGGAFRAVNPAWGSILGYALEDLAGASLGSVVHPDDADRTLASFAAAGGGALGAIEARVRHRNGSYRWISWTGAHDDGLTYASGRDVTAEKAAQAEAQEKAALLEATQAEAQEKAALLEATLENMDQGLIMVDGAGIVQVCNRRAIQMLNLPPEYWHAKPSFAEFIAHQIAIGEFAGMSEERQPWLKLSGNIRSSPPLYERSRPDGTVLEIRTVHLPDGSAIRTFTDISARKRAEDELKESEIRYRLLAETATDMIIRTGLNGVRRYVSPACREILGFTPEELVGTRLIDMVHPEDRPAVAPSLAALYEGRVDQGTLTYRARHRDGHWVWLEARRRLIRDPDGAPVELVSVIRDISERRRLEDELRAALEANKAILDHSLDVICTMDERGRFTQVSPQAVNVWGYRPQELIGRLYLDLVHPDDRAKTVKIAARIMAGTPTTGFENRYIRRDGTAVPILWSAVWSDEHKMMFCIARDLSERLQLEDQLRQSQKMQAVGQLTGGIAHDFNNLLTVILGNAELLAENPGDAALTATLSRQILETAERGADLNQKLLAFGRRQSLKPQRLRLDRVVAGMAPLLQRTIGEHIELRTGTEPSDLSAFVDRSLLESAILNLVVNARDAMRQGGVLTIATGERTALYGEGALPVGQPVVFVTVSDTGTGMSPEVVERAFEPFFTTKEVGKGSGLGLSMVFGFAQQSAGHVAIESRVGAGTAVTLVLPGVTGEVEQAAPAPARGPAPAAMRARILAVEDEPQVMQFVSSQLLALGCEVTAVSAGQDALDLLESGRAFDLLFTDVMLPRGMSGVELVKRARQIRPDIKVLLTSGYPEEVFEHHGRPEDMPLLRKPYRRGELAETLRLLLSGARPPVPRADRPDE
ncbi:MAG TPA: PAS domain S-box protein [Microvirga sp.]|nr:PAS domain S-box protein [Microvirga sp.]